MGYKKEDKISTKINCYFLIFNLIVSIIAFSSMIQIVDAQDGSAKKGVWADESELYKDRTACEQGKDESSKSKCHVAKIQKDVVDKNKEQKFETLQKESASNKQKLDYIQETIGKEIGVEFQEKKKNDKRDLNFRSEKLNLMYKEKIVLDQKYKNTLKDLINKAKDEIKKGINEKANEIQKKIEEIDLKINQNGLSQNIKELLETERAELLATIAGIKGNSFFFRKPTEPIIIIFLDPEGYLTIGGRTRTYPTVGSFDKELPLIDELKPFITEEQINAGLIPDITLKVDRLETFLGTEGSLPIDSEKLFNTPIGSLVEGGILDKFFPRGTTIGDVLGNPRGFISSVTDRIKGTLGNVKSLLIFGALAVGAVGLFIGMNLRGKSKVEPNEKGGLTAKVSKGSAVTVQKKNEKIKAIAVSKEDGTEGTIETTTSETTIGVKNTDVVIPGQIFADIPNEDTEIVMEGSLDDDPSSPPESSSSVASLSGTEVTPSGSEGLDNSDNSVGGSVALNLPLITPSITGRQISNFGIQSIVLKNHEILLRGNDIRVHTVKTWKSLKGNGMRLFFYSGNFAIGFNNQQTLASRVFFKIPKGVTIENNLDSSNVFKLQDFVDIKQKGQFRSLDERVTFGDFAIKNPSENKLIIAKQREKMYA
jgi:hypothetical protein